MNREQLITKLKKLKPFLEKEGFVIDGLFGSYARGEQIRTSDIDLLYHLDSMFLEQFGGFIGFKKLDEIKKVIEKELDLRVDLAPSNNLSKTAQKYILRDVIYV